LQPEAWRGGNSGLDGIEGIRAGVVPMCLEVLLLMFGEVGEWGRELCEVGNEAVVITR
jgi:hypothetical protein